MAFEDKIVASINSTLVTASEGDTALSSNQYYGIAEPYETTGEPKQVSMGVINLDGEVTDVAYNDAFHIVGYHKLINSTLQAVTGQAYGDKKTDFLLSTSEMELVIQADRKRVKKNPRQLANIIFSYLPAEQFTITDTTGVKAGNASLTFLGFNFDSLSLFGRDYRGTQNFISPALMLFSIRYRIESNFRKECFNTCLC